MKKVYKKNFILLAMLLFVIATFSELSITAKAQEDPIVIVIDPGHGGENIGAVNDMWLEKDMTLITALAIKDELDKYDGITVYLTRTEDKDLSLNERAEFASSVSADFLFSIHYNDSTAQNLYGTEIWIQSSGSYYVKDYAFAELFLERMTGLGLYNRGIKTRLNDAGDEWYGILRSSKKLEIPAVLMEHCHVSSLDKEYVDTVDKLQNFGKLDADAIAEYFGLKNDEHDYSERTLSTVLEPQEAVAQDLLPPEYVEIRPLPSESPEDFIIELTACDSQTGLKYYSISKNNGLTWSELYKFDISAACMGNIVIQSEVLNDDVTSVLVRVYDGYDNISESNTLIYPYFKKAESPRPYDITGYIKEALPRLYDTYHEITVKDILRDLDTNIVYVAILIFSIVFMVITILCWVFICSIFKNNKKAVHVTDVET